MDWETLYCPHRHCRGYGKPFSQGYLVKNGTSRGQPRAWCTACEASVVLSYGTAYYGLEADPTIFETAVRALAEGNALRATARIPFGQLQTYSQMAAKAGSPRAHRAAGNALGSNKMPIVVPCHRVVRTGGALGGYTGGIERKKFLLGLEASSKS